jgi:hypothetical protein
LVFTIFDILENDVVHNDVLIILAFCSKGTKNFYERGFFSIKYFRE